MTMLQAESITNTKGESISNQPDLFLTDPQSQDFHSVLGHRNKTYVQNLSIISLLVDKDLEKFPIQSAQIFRTYGYDYV